jgi:hypothetical protein
MDKMLIQLKTNSSNKAPRHILTQYANFWITALNALAERLDIQILNSEIKKERTNCQISQLEAF